MRTALEQLYNDVLAIKAQIQALVHPNTQVIEDELDKIAECLSDIS